MPIHFTYEKDSQILSVKLSGSVTLDEIQQASLLMLQNNQIPSDTNALWDVSEMEFHNITLEFQQSLIELRKQFDSLRGNAKIAILSDYTLAEPLLKMYTILSKELSQETQVFMVEEDARQWLSE